MEGQTNSSLGQESSQIQINKSLEELEMHGDFIRRHIGPGEVQIKLMLDELELDSLDDLIAQAVPPSIMMEGSIELNESKNERETITYLREMRARNKIFVSMIGMGYYGTVMPSVIKRNVLENPGWYTAYTPYQAEVSQGRLEALLNFQQMVTDLTGMELANASLLDEATAAAEAMMMLHRISKSSSNAFFVSQECHPQTIAVVQTRAKSLGLDIILGNASQELTQIDCFGALLQYPGTSGLVEDIRLIIEQAHAQQTLVAVASDLLSLALLKPPGEMGADAVLGNSQRFGVPLGYGGPHAAFFAMRESHKRYIPGRLIGVSKDSLGQPALRMALQTREQHIRREKATSNICTSQVLLAVIAAFYAIYHGPEGIRTIANRVHRMTLILVEGLRQLGYEVVTQSFFDTVTVKISGQARRIAAKARESHINLRVVDADHLGISFDETTRRRDLEQLWNVFKSDASTRLNISDLDHSAKECIPSNCSRTSEYLTHPVFQRYQSETEMLRYLHRLQNKDLALDRTMIPLGSCTMKLNATTEMFPISYWQFSTIHPFVPLEQAQGYQQLFDELETMLCACTGFDAISLQPNAGSQGEYTGLLVIRKYHESRGEHHRNVCLIPSSAHGTNPASAVMAGLKVVVVDCEEQGDISIEDLRRKAEQHRNELAALMITYPSTHGVFEETFIEICEIIHELGGQVYLDGANLNALLGISQPGMCGADVAHINLHKTFCIPHGGGGPGMGPIGVGQHLAPYLPDHPVVEGVNPAAAEDSTIGAVSAAPWGSAGILPISWAYISMMGSEGLRRATQIAVLNANYIAKRLEEYYSVLFRGRNNMVAHECIIDIRPLKESCGVIADDIAKRLIDYGFHAPTISWPVPETFMIEPTESESKLEIDRFCDAMIAIRKEIAEIESGEADPQDNLLKNAPHTHKMWSEQEWTKSYSIQRAFFPIATLAEDKYWPPVARVDNAYGDRNLNCACPLPRDYR